jgi:hypothetical protein
MLLPFAVYLVYTHFTLSATLSHGLPAFTIRMSRHCLGSLRAANFSPFHSNKFNVYYYTRIRPDWPWGPLIGYRLSFPVVKRSEWGEGWR